MSKFSDLASVLKDKFGLSQQESEDFINTMFDIVCDRLQNGEDFVKIKKLGSFKLKNVSSRESININTGERITIEGRNKIAFAPDQELRDRVNKPFSQFETVAVNEGVDFSDIDTEPVADDGEAAAEAAATAVGITQEPVQETKEEQPEVAEPDTDAEEPVTAEPEKPDTDADEAASPSGEAAAVPDEAANVPGKDNATSEEGSAAPVETPKEATYNFAPLYQNKNEEDGRTTEPQDISPNDGEPQYPIEAVMDKLRTKNRTIVTLLIIIVLLVAAGVYGIYYHNMEMRQKLDRILDLEITVDNIHSKCMEEDSASVSSQQKAQNSGIVADSGKKAAGKTAIASTDSKEAAKPQDNADKYNADPRIRTGAYTITGIEKTVTMKRGQTLKSISKAMFGEGMECYVEAVNTKKEYKEGDSVNIPSIKLKKKKSRKRPSE